MTQIHVYQQRIRQNAKLPADQQQPPLIVRQGRGRLYGSEVEIAGPCRLVYRPEAPLPCGAKVWLEVDDGVAVTVTL